jgi:hypothetical protein
VSDRPRRQWNENPSSHNFHSREPLSATTVGRAGPACLGRNGLLRFGFAIMTTIPDREKPLLSGLGWILGNRNIIRIKKSQI